MKLQGSGFLEFKVSGLGVRAVTNFCDKNGGSERLALLGGVNPNSCKKQGFETDPQESQRMKSTYSLHCSSFLGVTL